MITRPMRAGMAAVAVFGAVGLLLATTASAENATKEEIDAAVKFYESIKNDPDKQKAYCEVRQGIKMMTSDPKKFAEAQQKVAAATKQLGPDFIKAQSLQTRLDMKSEETMRYTAARQALDQICH